MNSIARYLTVTLTVGFALSLGAGGAAIYLSARAALYREFDSSLKVKTVAMVALTKPGHDKVELEFPKRIRPVEGGSGLMEYYQLFTTGGVSLARSPALGDADLPGRFGTLAAPLFWNLILPDGTPGRAIGVRFTAHPPAKEKKPPPPKAEPKPKPPVPVEFGLIVADSLAALDAKLNALSLILFGAGLLTLLTAALLVPRVLRRGLTPLRHLAARAGHINAGSLQYRFPSGGWPAELVPIARQWNDLLARLEDSFQRERRFSADLAHELRTPLAGLRSIAEVELKYGDTAAAEPLRSVLEITRQMEDLVTRLLTLTRAEQNTILLRPERVMLAPLLHALWEPLQLKATAKQLTTRFDLPGDAALETDPFLLRGILDNLLANSANYTPARGSIHLGFTRTADQFALTITNTTEELTPAELPRLFERFWRKDNARSDAEHAGLGLSLAKAFASLLGMHITASFPADRTLSLTLSGHVAPVAPPSAAPSDDSIGSGGHL